MLPVFAEVQKLKDVGIIPKKARPSPALCHADHRRGWPRGGACRRQPAGRHNRAKQDRLPKVARRVSVANQPVRGRQLCPHRAKTDHRALGFAAHTFTQVCPRPAGAGLTPSPLRCGSSLPSAISALLRFSFQRFRFSAFQPFSSPALRHFTHVSSFSLQPFSLSAPPLSVFPAQSLIDNDQIRAIPKSHRESVTFTGIQHKETTVFAWRWLDLNPLHIPQVGNFDSATSHALLDDARHNADVAVHFVEQTEAADGREGQQRRRVGINRHSDDSRR